jgi:hypothetical protein
MGSLLPGDRRLLACLAEEPAPIFEVLTLRQDVSGIAVVRVSERLCAEDYERVAVRLDSCRRVLVEAARDFERAPADAAWQAPETALPARPLPKRVAVVADIDSGSALQATFHHLFPGAEVRFFENGERNAAENWLLSPPPPDHLPPASG